ncbi:unnamed protein product, partial [Ectocarpus fasciculatus]
MDRDHDTFQYDGSSNKHTHTYTHMYGENNLASPMTPPLRGPRSWPLEAISVFSRTETGVFSLVSPLARLMATIKTHARMPEKTTKHIKDIKNRFGPTAGRTMPATKGMPSTTHARRCNRPFKIPQDQHRRCRQLPPSQ